ncbi:MAG: nitroreductase family protein [Actinomycetota bacterium]|nr:nitroreductase family protein [Actinomycetota bacterium]
MAGAFPDRAVLESALDLAARAPSPQNTQPWRWRVTGASLHLHADFGRGVAASDAARRDVLLSCGAILDHCVVALAAAGWVPQVRRFPESADSGHVALLEVIEGPPNEGDRELAAAARRRRSDRDRYRVARLPAGTLELLSVHAARRGVEFGVVPRIRWARGADDTVALRFADGSEGDAAAAGDGAVLIVLATGRDDDPARVAAGEALSNILLSATAMGLSSCTVSEPLHDARSRLALACEVFDGQAYPQVLIRVGLARPGGILAAATVRRTAAQTTTWEHE